MEVKKILLGTTMAISSIAAATSQNNINSSATSFSDTKDTIQIWNNGTGNNYNEAVNDIYKFNALSGDGIVNKSSVDRITRATGNDMETKLEKILMGNYLLSNILPTFENTVYDYKNDQAYKSVASVSKFDDFYSKKNNFDNIRKATKLVMADNSKLMREQLGQIEQGVTLVVGDNTKKIGLEYRVYAIEQDIYKQFADYSSYIYNKQTENVDLANDLSDLTTEMKNIHLEDALNIKKEDFDRLKKLSLLFNNEVDALNDKIDNVKALLQATMNYALTTPNNKDSYEQYNKKLIDLNKAIDDLQQEKRINSDKSLNEKISQAKSVLNKMISNTESTITNFSDEDEMAQKYINNLNKNRIDILQAVNDVQYEVNKEFEPSYDFIHVQNKMYNALSGIDNTKNDYRREIAYKDVAFVSQFEDIYDKKQNLIDIQSATKQVLTDNGKNIKELTSQIEDGFNLIGNENSEIIDLKNEIKVTGQILNRYFPDASVDIYNKQTENICLAKDLSDLTTEMKNIHLEDALNIKKEDFDRLKKLSLLFNNEVDALNDKIDNVKALLQATMNYALTTPNNKDSYEQYNKKLIDLNKAIDDLQQEKKINSDASLNEKLSQAKKILNKMISKTGYMVANFSGEDAMSQNLMNNIENRKLQYRGSIIKLLAKYEQSQKETDGIKNADAETETNTKYYNLGGQVTNPNKSGIYIINGKKIIKK